MTIDGSVPQTTAAPEPAAGQTPNAWKVVGAKNNDDVAHDVIAFVVCARGS